RHDPRAEVVDHDVGYGGQVTGEIETAGVVQVDHHAPLAPHERSREAAAALTEVDASATLDLDHLRAEVGENARGDRARDHPREVEDADAVEGAHHTSPSGGNIASSSPYTSALCSLRPGGRATRQGASPRRHGAPG